MWQRAGQDPSEIRVRLAEARPDILYDLPPAQRARAARRLRRLGVELITGDPLADVGEEVAHLKSGRAVECPVIVWCGGAKSDPHAVSWGLAADNSGRLVVDATLRADAHEDIYIAGDIAGFRDEGGEELPMLAQYAIREGAQAAENILCEVRDQPLRPLKTRMHGEFVSIGPGWGVGWWSRVNVSGWPAIFLKRLTYVLYWLQVGSFRLAWRRTRQMLAMHR
jgi:NADH dehydrogenase